MLLLTSLYIFSFLQNSVNQGYASVDDILSSVRPQWKQEVICIKNYVGDALRKMSTAKQINDYFDKSQSSICQKEFFALLSASSDNAINAETLSIEEHRKMLVDIRDGGERRWFEREMKHIEQEEAKKTNIAGSVRIADSVKQLPIGVEAIGPYLQEIAMSTFANQLPSMKEQLMKELLKYRKYSDAIQSELDSLDPVKAKDLYWEFVGEYVRTLESLIAFKTKYGKTDDKVVDPVRFIMSFEEEYKTAHSGQAYVGTIIPTYEDLVSEVEKIPNPGSTGLPYQIKEAKYYGEAAKSRLIEVIMFIFLQMPLIEMTDEVMINCMVSAEDGVHKLNAEKGLRCLLEPSVRNLSLMVDWIVNHVSWLLKKHNEDAIISVIQNPANARFLTIKERHQHFIDQFDERFQQLVGNQTDRIRRSMVELINDYSVTIDIYEPYWLMSVLAEAEFSPTLLLDPVNNNGGEGLGSGFLSILGKMIGGSSGLTGKSVTEALQHFQSTANKVSHSSPVQVSPILVGEMNNVDTQQVLLTAEQHFYMIKNILARRVKTIIHAQYQYFVNVYLNEFNQACMKFVSSWTIEQIKEIIEQSNQGINKLESEAKQIKENLMELEELKKAIEELERENRISFAKTKSSIENLFNKNNKKSSAQSPNQSTADGDASAKSSTANGASGSESKSSTGPKAADPNNKSEPKAEPKPKSKPEPKTESKPEPKTEPKTENKPEPKTGPKTEPKTESKPEPHKEQKEL